MHTPLNITFDWGRDAGSHAVAQATLELIAIFLAQPSKF